MRRQSGKVTVLMVGLAVFLSGCTILNTGPVARFEVTPIVIYVGEEVTFDASSSSSEQCIVSYNWEFGDGRTASGQEVTTSYAEPGCYEVVLQVTDAGGGTTQVSDDVFVYLRSGSEVFSEDFSTGTQSLSGWQLDPTWASTGESKIENLSGLHGFVLHIDSGIDRWHRRTATVRTPPLRVGQQLVFSCQVMTAHSQDAHTFFIFPVRGTLDSLAGSLPYFVYTSERGGAYIFEPDIQGNEVDHLLSFKPGVYLWYTYKFVFSPQEYKFYINDVLYASGTVFESFTEEGDWLILLGDESHDEACDAYFDDIKVWVEE